MSSLPFSHKYEPLTVTDICGNRDIFNKIENLVCSNKSYNFILMGPNGIGKTIFANIIKQNLQKININTRLPS